MNIKCKNTPVNAELCDPLKKLDFADFISLVHENMLFFVKESSTGHLHSILESHLSVEGKRIRSKVVYELGSFLKVPYFDLIQLATASELLHEATLIHDDIQDEDEVRRGEKTFWKKHGLSHAINAGDFLLMLSLKPLLELNNPALLKLHTETSFSLAQGQAEEIFNKENCYFARKDFYQSCIEQKTASLFSCLAESVGVLAKIENAHLESIKSLFLEIGCLFQMQDDLLDLYGNKQRESIGCDIKEGKISFLIHTHLENHPNDLDEIKIILTKTKALTTYEDICQLKALFETKGTLAHSTNSIMSKAQACLESAESNPLFAENSDFIKRIISLILKPIEHILHADSHTSLKSL